MTLMVAPRGRSATAKNSAMAIAAGLIWRAIFVFIRHSLLPFPSENFYRRCKNFSEPEFFCRGLYGLRGIATQSETKRKPLSNIAFTTSERVLASTNGGKITTPRPPRRLPGGRRALFVVPVEGSLCRLNPDYS